MAKTNTITLVDDLGNANPVERTNAGYVGPLQSAKVYTGTQALAAGPITIPLETVPAGKIFFITDIYISANTAVQFAVTINAGGVPIFQGFCKGDTGAIQMAGMETQPQASAGQQVNLVLGLAAGTIGSYYIGGVDQV